LNPKSTIAAEQKLSIASEPVGKVGLGDSTSIYTDVRFLSRSDKADEQA
jgi:hypothetical protein